MENMEHWEKMFDQCPDCGHDKFLRGPEGGMAINFRCANPACDSEFNTMGPFGVERIGKKRLLEK